MSSTEKPIRLTVKKPKTKKIKKTDSVCKNCRYYRSFIYPGMADYVAKNKQQHPTGYCKRRSKQKREDETCTGFEYNYDLDKKKKK